MTTISLDSLRTPYTETSLLNTHLRVLREASFPVTSWASTSVPYVLVKSNSTATLDLANTIPLIAEGAYLGLARTGWLSLLASQNYLVDRIPAKFTVRTLRLTNTSGSVQSVVAGALWVQTEEGLKFVNTQSGTIGAASGSTLSLSFRAEETGDEYNDPTDSWSMVSALAGVTVDEPGGVPVITVQGAGEESDAALTARARERWGTLGAGGNADAYKYWAKNAPGLTETITRVKVREAYPLPGQVTLYLATATGSVNTTPSNSSVTQSGTGPAVTVSGTPVESFSGRVEITLGGARGTAEFRYSIDGETWVDGLVTAATYAVDDTGVTLNFPVGTYVLAESYTWSSVASTLTIVQNYIDPATHLGVAPNCVDVTVSAATAYTVTPTAVVYVSGSSYRAGVEAQRSSIMSNICSETEIGGTLYRAEIIQRFMDLPGVVNVSLTVPAADVSLAAYEVAVPGAITGITVSVVS